MRFLTRTSYNLLPSIDMWVNGEYSTKWQWIKAESTQWIDSRRGGVVISAITLEHCYEREMIAGEQEEAEDRVIDS